MYRIAFESANRATVSLVTTVAMLAACLLALSWDRPVGATPPGENGRIAFSSLQAFPGEDFEVYTMLPDGTGVRQLTEKSGGDQMPTWSPDGAKVGWVRGEQFWVHDFKTGHARMVVSIEGGIGSEVVWSPNGSKLAYTRQTPNFEGLSDIFVMNTDGTDQTNLTKTQSVDEWNPNWAPDGSKLAYTRHTWPTTRKNQPDIYSMNADGTNPTNLTDSMPEGMSVGNPNWSPDGTKVAFQSCPWEGVVGTCGIYVMNADGTNPVNITSATTPKLYGSPVWSPDGTKMAFLSGLGEDGQNCNIYVMNADGTNPVNITDKEDYCGFGGTGAGDILDWQPLPEPAPPKSRSVTVYPPDTGGPSLLLVVSALLFFGGVLLHALVRRTP